MISELSLSGTLAQDSMRLNAPVAVSALRRRPDAQPDAVPEVRVEPGQRPLKVHLSLEHAGDHCVQVQLWRRVAGARSPRQQKRSIHPLPLRTTTGSANLAAGDRTSAWKAVAPIPRGCAVSERAFLLDYPGEIVECQKRGSAVGRG